MDQLINGLSLGSIYALVALGYTMVYGIIRLINFAHGDVLMIGAYVGFALINVLRLDFLSALVLAMVVCAVLGITVERVAYKPLRNSARITALITAIGVSYLLQNTMSYFVGAETQVFPEALPKISFSLLGTNVSLKQVLIFVVTIVLMVVLTFIVQKTKMGKAMRAVSTDTEAAQLMGINVDRVISFTFLIGSVLAGAAGVLVGVYYNAMTPLMGVAPGLKAFIAAVFGGIGSIPGAMVGGYFIGLVETYVNSFGGSLYKDAVVYGILIIILLFKPSGLLGKNVKEKV